MTAYTPHHGQVVAAVLVFGMLIFLAGGVINRSPFRLVQRLFTWCLAILAVIVIERLAAMEPAGVRMVAIVLVLLWGMKLVVVTEAKRDGGPALPVGRWFCFLFGWPGMQPAVFARPLKPNRKLAGQFLSHGVSRLVLGIGFLILAHFWTSTTDVRTIHDFVSLNAMLCLLIGLSLVLHFGLFNLLAAAWQAIGWNCQPLFRAPLASASLSEFWSRRWNLAFSEMTAIAVFRPYQKSLGVAGALFAGFAFSGLLHELAITVPVQAGYGGPLGYFLLHGVLVLIERRFDLPKRCGIWYRAAMLICLLGPLPWLFPPTFLREIAWPLAGVEG